MIERQPEQSGRPGPIPLADSHIHLFADSFSEAHRDRHPEGEPAQYEVLRARFGIEDALVIGYEGEPRFAGNNAYILKLAASRDWIHPVMYVDQSTDSNRAAPLLAGGYVGVSIYVDPDRCGTDSWVRWADEIFGLASDLSLILSLNAPAASHATVAELAGRHPNARILLSHLGLPGVAPDPHSAGLAATRHLILDHQCWVKMSGTYAGSRPGESDPYRSTSAWMDWLIEAAGVERLIWGSDFSPALERMTFEQTVELPPLRALSVADQISVYGGTLRKLLMPGQQGGRR